MNRERERIIRTMSMWELDLYAQMGGTVPADLLVHLRRWRERVAANEFASPERREAIMAETWKTFQQDRAQHEQRIQQTRAERAAGIALVKNARAMVGPAHLKKRRAARPCPVTVKRDRLRRAIQDYIVAAQRRVA